jgi:ABC-type dipeptide/oligopeptide/nickel transport system ATPase component
VRTIGYLLRYADEIVVLESGQLVDKGSLEDLMAKSTYIQGLQTSLPKPTSSIDSRSSETVMATPFSVEQDRTAEERANEAVPSENDDLLGHEAPSDPTRRNGDLSVYT